MKEKENNFESFMMLVSKFDLIPYNFTDNVEIEFVEVLGQ